MQNISGQPFNPFQGRKHAYYLLNSNDNGRVERSHSNDEQEFYQRLRYTDDVNLKKKLIVWKEFYNLWRPLSSHNGKTSYEISNEKMKSAV